MSNAIAEDQSPVNDKESTMAQRDSDQQVSIESNSSFRIPLPALELIIGLALLATISFYLFEAYSLPKPYNAMDIGAGGFPMLLGIATLIGIILMLVISIYHLVIGGKIFGIVVAKRPFFVVAAIGIVIAQALLFELMGVVACVGIGAFLTMLACGERRPFHLVCVPVALVLFIYVVFVVALKVHFP